MTRYEGSVRGIRIRGRGKGKRYRRLGFLAIEFAGWCAVEGPRLGGSGVVRRALGMISDGRFGKAFLISGGAGEGC